MRRCVRGILVVLALCGSLAPAVPAQAVEERRAAPVPLERLFDNVAVSDDDRPGQADFDGAGASLSARDLNSAGWTPGRGLTVQGARLTCRGGSPASRTTSARPARTFTSRGVGTPSPSWWRARPAPRWAARA